MSARHALALAAAGASLIAGACSSPTADTQSAPVDAVAVLSGTWDVRANVATIASASQSGCDIDPSVGPVCLTDTLGVVTFLGSITISGTASTMSVRVASFQNSPGKPRCSGSPTSTCWSLFTVGDADFWSSPAFGAEADTASISFAFGEQWTGAAPSFHPSPVDAFWGVVIRPPYLHAYDSTRYGVIELTKR